MSRMALPDPAALAAAVSGRDRLALATALNLLDDRRPEARQCAADFWTLCPRKNWTRAAT